MCFFKDVGISVVFALSLFAGATASAAYASDNADYYDEFESQCNRGSVRGDLCDDVETIRDSEGATAVSYAWVAPGGSESVNEAVNHSNIVVRGFWAMEQKQLWSCK